MKFNLTIKDMTLVGMCAALMAIFSQISIPLPFTAVPLTLQTFGVVIISVIMKHKLGTLSILTWILLGSIGIPVFANFSGGFSKIAGPTGGYIYGFALMALIIGYTASKSNKFLLFLGVYLGLAVLYGLGVLQLKIVLGLTLNQALAAGLYPFIVKGLIEVALAALLGLAIEKTLLRGKILSVNP